MRISSVITPVKRRLKIPVRLFLVLTLAGAFLSSCAVFSVKKRRYMKGYFVECRFHKSPERHVAKDQPSDHQPAAGPAQAKVPETKKINPEAGVPFHGSTGRDIAENKVLTADAAAAHSKQDRKLARYLSDRNFTPVVVRHQLTQIRQLSGAGEKMGIVRAVLSLMWIAVVVILILYLLGLLIGDFGPIIHALPVVAVVVLVLWLLKII